MARSTLFASFLLPALLLLCSFGVPLAADIVPISIYQQVSVSGGAQACDPLCQMFGIGGPDSGQSFSPPSQTNTQLPPANLYVSGSVTDSDSRGNGYVSTASANADASQWSTLNASNIQLILSGGSFFYGNDTLMQAWAGANSQYSLQFRLTSPYLVHLTGKIDFVVSANLDIGPEVSSDNEIHLTGPGFQFDQSLAGSGGGFNQLPFDASYTLAPGIYTLGAVSELDAYQGYFLQDTFGTYVSLNADFTAIPEPERVTLVLGLLTLFGLSFARRRQTSSSC